jgi:hypothetical protein
MFPNTCSWLRCDVGTLFYMTNIVCHFLLPGLSYESSHPRVGIAVGSEKYIGQKKIIYSSHFRMCVARLVLQDMAVTERRMWEASCICQALCLLQSGQCVVTLVIPGTTQIVGIVTTPQFHSHFTVASFRTDSSGRRGTFALTTLLLTWWRQGAMWRIGDLWITWKEWICFGGGGGWRGGGE